MLFTSFGSICIITLSGELRVAVEFVSAQPDILILVPLYSLSGYMSMACILAMVRLFGATDTEIVKSLRKVCRRVASACGRTRLALCNTLSFAHIRPPQMLSVILSFIFFGKQARITHVSGIALVIAALSISVYCKPRQNNAPGGKEFVTV